MRSSVVAIFLLALVAVHGLPCLSPPPPCSKSSAVAAEDSAADSASSSSSSTDESSSAVESASETLTSSADSVSTAASDAVSSASEVVENTSSSIVEAASSDSSSSNDSESKTNSNSSAQTAESSGDSTSSSGSKGSPVSVVSETIADAIAPVSGDSDNDASPALAPGHDVPKDLPEIGLPIVGHLVKGKLGLVKKILPVPGVPCGKPNVGPLRGLPVPPVGDVVKGLPVKHGLPAVGSLLKPKIGLVKNILSIGKPCGKPGPVKGLPVPHAGDIVKGKVNLAKKILPVKGGPAKNCGKPGIPKVLPVKKLFPNPLLRGGKKPCAKPTQDGLLDADIF